MSAASLRVQFAYCVNFVNENANSNEFNTVGQYGLTIAVARSFISSDNHLASASLTSCLRVLEIGIHASGERLGHFADVPSLDPVHELLLTCLANTPTATLITYISKKELAFCLSILDPNLTLTMLADVGQRILYEQVITD